jgi:hypothetical protein
VTELMGVDPSVFTETLMFELYGVKNFYYLIRPIFGLEKTPAFASFNRPTLMSLPMYSFHSQAESFDDLKYSKVLIQLNDPSDRELTNRIRDDLQVNLPSSVGIEVALD